MAQEQKLALLEAKYEKLLALWLKTVSLDAYPIQFDCFKLLLKQYDNGRYEVIFEYYEEDDYGIINCSQVGVYYMLPHVMKLLSYELYNYLAEKHPEKLLESLIADLLVANGLTDRDSYATRFSSSFTEIELHKKSPFTILMRKGYDVKDFYLIRAVTPLQKYNETIAYVSLREDGKQVVIGLYYDGTDVITQLLLNHFTCL